MKKYITALVAILSVTLTGITVYADSAAPDYKLFGTYYYFSEIKRILIGCLIIAVAVALIAAIILLIIKTAKKKKNNNKKEE